MADVIEMVVPAALPLDQERLFAPGVASIHISVRAAAEYLRLVENTLNR